MESEEKTDKKEGGLEIHNVYIIVDGVVVFHRVYGSIKKDPALVSSFLGAITSLSREITGQGILKSIEMPPIKINALQVMDSPQVLVAVAASHDFPSFALNKILVNVGEAFLDKFADKILNIGMRDLSNIVKGDIHQAIVKGLREVTQPYDPRDPKHRANALLKHYTSPKYSCPCYDARLRSKCRLDPETFRVADCEGVAFSSGLPCAGASQELASEESE
nr:hypothetical protein [Candidatus Njordarchaeum guaymaensis]